MRTISPGENWIPVPYMLRALDFLTQHYVAGLPLKPGARKTSITLAAFETLRRAGKARTMLVVAPLRVCRQTWRQEAAKWQQFRHLKFALLHGDNKGKALKSGADVYLINPEGVAWLHKQYMGRQLPFDVVAIDELTKFMNSQAQRFKDLRPHLKGVPYRWGLTGSLFAKGHLNIFGQQLILDDGAALGRYFTHYRDEFFHADFTGFNYELLPGAEKRIVEKLAPYWFHMDDADYTQLPPLVDVPRIAELEPAQRKLYDKMKRDMLAELPGGTITAANAGACYSKLAQMANGAVYREDRAVVKIHDLKLDMLEELMDELGGEPLLLAYEFNHDLDRIREWYTARSGKELPYLGKGTTAKQENEWVAAWNRGEIELLAAHPQSAGHGLNMQEGQAANIAWFSVSWDWELYDQFIRRVRRSGNDNQRIFNHLLIVRDTIDEKKLEAVRGKDFTERRLITALNNEILRESQEATGEVQMVTKLSRPGAAEPKTQQAGAAPGWGAQSQAQPQAAAERTAAPAAAGWGPAPTDDTAQRQRIQEQIAPEDRASAAQAAFSGGVQSAVGAIADADYGTAATPQAAGWGASTAEADRAKPRAAATEAPKPTRRRPPKDEAPAPADNTVDAQALVATALIAARARVLAAVIGSDPDASVEDIVDVSRDLMEFVERG